MSRVKLEPLTAPRFFWALLLVLILLGGVLRFWNLATVPADPREVGSAAISARILHTSDYRHNPLTHGPLLYYLDAAAFAAGGVSIGAARVVPALVGALLPLAFLPFRRHLGNPGVLAAAGLYAVSPTQIAVAHLNTPDTLLLLLDLLVLAAVLRFLERGDGRAFLAGALLFGLSATAKEQTILNALLALAAVAVLAVLRREWVAPLLGLEPGRGRGAARSLDELLGGLLWFAGRHRRLILQGLLLFFAAFVLLYTSFLANLPGLLLGLLQLVIWATGTISPQFLAAFYGPPWYYAPFLVRFDLVLALLGLAGGAWAWRRGRKVEAFLVLLGLLLFVFFSAIPYKNSKLLAYPLLPWTLVAGSFVARLVLSAGVRRMAAGAACGLVVLQSAAGLAGLPGLPGVLDTTPDPRYAPLEEMSAIIEEAGRAHPDLRVFLFSPAEVSVGLVDTSYYFIWGTRYLREQPFLFRIESSLDRNLQACAQVWEPGFALNVSGVLRERAQSNKSVTKGAAWDLCVSELLRAAGQPAVGTTGDLAFRLLDSPMRKAGYAKVSLNTTLSGPLVAYLPGRLVNESREMFARYPALTVEWLPGSAPSLVPA